MKKQADRERKEAEIWKVGDKIMLSMKNLVFKEWLVKKLVDWYVGPYIIKEVISTNAVKLWLPTSMRIHLVVNVSQIVWYRDQVGEQKKEEVKPVEVEKILNKRKVREMIKYLVQSKEFTAEHNSWEKEENLENAKESVAEFEKRINAEVRRQEKLDLAEERDFRREELLGKYIAKILFG